MGRFSITIRINFIQLLKITPYIKLMMKFSDYIKPFEAVVSPLSAFFAGTTFTCMGYALLTSILSIRMNANGVSTSEIGIILSLYYVGYIFASMTAFKIINKVGHIRAFSAYISLFSALALLHIFSPNPTYWGVLRVLEGYCIGSSMMCLESWLNARANNKNRGLIMSLYMVTTYLGSSLGQLLLNIPDKSGVVIYVVVSVIFSVALVPISLTALPTPDISIHKSMSLKELYKISPVGVVGCLCSGVFVGAFYTLGTVFAANSGLDIKQTSIFMFMGIIGGMLAQIPIGRLSDLMDRRYVMMWICGILFVISPWINLFINAGTLAVAASSFLLGTCIFVIYPICVSHVNDKIDDSSRVNASGRLIMLQSLGMIFGPVIISFLMQEFGALSFLLSISGVSGAFVLFAFRYIAFHDVNYINVTPTAPIPAAPTHAFSELSQDDTLMDKAKELLAEKKH